MKEQKQAQEFMEHINSFAPSWKRVREVNEFLARVAAQEVPQEEDNKKASELANLPLPSLK